MAGGKTEDGNLFASLDTLEAKQFLAKWFLEFHTFIPFSGGLFIY